MKNYSTDKRVIIGIIIGFVLTIFGGVMFIFVSGSPNREIEAQGALLTTTEVQEVEEQILSQTYIDAVWFQDNPYLFNRELHNILFIGVDSRGEIEEGADSDFAGQADAIMLITLNSNSGTAQMIQISRDTIAQVDVIGESGEVISSLDTQIALQHSYGGGGRSSAFAMRRSIQRLLYGLPIHGYIVMYMDAIHTLNDEIGGVTITFSEDYSFIDSAFTEGETVTLDGIQAERFVQYRDMSDRYGNENRMQRQSIYLLALFQALREFANDTLESYAELYEILQPFMLTDLRVDVISNFISYDYDGENVSFLPGVMARGGRYAEFHVDMEELEEMIINTFYLPMER